MSSRGNSGARTTSRNAGARVPLSEQLPSAASLAYDSSFQPDAEGLNQNVNGLYGRMTDAEKEDASWRGLGYDKPLLEYENATRYANQLGSKPAFQTMVSTVLEHWDTQRMGFHYSDPNAFSQKMTPAEMALYAVFRGYDSVSRHGEMNPMTTAIQIAAKEAFNLKGTANTATAAERAKANALLGAAQPGLRLLLRTMYDNTQTWLAQHGITEAPLFRGSRFASGNQPKSIDWNGKTEARTIQSRPLSSWATILPTADAYSHAWSQEYDSTYGGYGLTTGAMVPASRIFSVEPTGFGRIDESEVVVLGGTDQAMVKAEHPIGTRNAFNDALFNEFGS